MSIRDISRSEGDIVSPHVMGILTLPWTRRYENITSYSLSWYFHVVDISGRAPNAYSTIDASVKEISWERQFVPDKRQAQTIAVVHLRYVSFSFKPTVKCRGHIRSME